MKDGVDYTILTDEQILRIEAQHAAFLASDKSGVITLRYADLAAQTIPSLCSTIRAMHQSCGLWMAAKSEAEGEPYRKAFAEILRALTPVPEATDVQEP